MRQTLATTISILSSEMCRARANLVIAHGHQTIPSIEHSWADSSGRLHQHVRGALDQASHHQPLIVVQPDAAGVHQLYVQPHLAASHDKWRLFGQHLRQPLNPL